MEVASHFHSAEAARRYHRYRPKTLGVIAECLRRTLPARRWRHALDIGCGTGDSMLPLSEVCDRVTGIDISAAMLTIARERGLVVQQSPLEDWPHDGAHDLIASTMAFHWLDPAVSIPACQRLSAPGAVWVIGNFGFAGHTSSEPFNRWFRDRYLVDYPSPPRHRHAQADLGAVPGLQLLDRHRGDTPLSMDLSELIGYLSTQSNIEHAVAQGRSYAAIESALHEQLGEFDLGGSFIYRHDITIARYQRH